MNNNYHIIVNDISYTTRPWPKQQPNPGKFKLMVYRDGEFVGAAKSRKEFEERAHRGEWDVATTENR